MNAPSESNVRTRSYGLALILIAVTAVWAIPRNACAQLYIAQQGAGERSGVVREYDASTGAVINAKFITGLQQPVALALSDDDLFVANMGGSVGKYNAATGVAISPASSRVRTSSRHRSFGRTANFLCSTLPTAQSGNTTPLREKRLS